MTQEDLQIRPHIERTPVHPSITREQISQLVDFFYGKIREEERLGPIFNQRIGNEWPEHLDKMKSFWRSILLKTGEYKGRPLPVHFQQKEVVSEDYKIWLSLFRETVREVFEADAAPLIIEAAERIAQSFWLAIFATPFDKAPAWIKSE